MRATSGTNPENADQNGSRPRRWYELWLPITWIWLSRTHSCMRAYSGSVPHGFDRGAAPTGATATTVDTAAVASIPRAAARIRVRRIDPPEVAAERRACHAP